MPELPEVETLKSFLEPRLVGRSIGAARILCTARQISPSAAILKRSLAGARIRSLTRRAKYLCLNLLLSDKTEASLLIHLRMSGRLDLVPARTPPAPHDRLVLELEKGQELRFNDVRRFGRVVLTSQPERHLSALGPEPLESTLTAESFHEDLLKRHCAIKPLLLNQKFIAGIGNIYADESLWRAGLHPRKIASSLSRRAAAKLLHAIRNTLKQAIRNQGTDFGDKVVDFGRHRPRIYGRTESPCPRCRTPIKYLRIGQRGTHICPRCQPG